MATHQGAAVKYEKLTFTPTRLIEIERTGEPGEKPWDNVVLKPGREVTFGPFRDYLHDDDWYIDDKRIHRVLHCDVERVYAQLTMEARHADADPDYPPLPVDVWSAELMFAGLNAADNPMCLPLVWVFRHREQAMPDQRVYTQYVSPAENQPQIREGEARQLAATRLCTEPPKSLGEATMFGIPPAKPGRLLGRRIVGGYRFPRPANVDMVSAIIASQVAAGGVDTEGTRAQAERWCAMLAGCICEGMRATTEQSALGLVPDRRFTSGKVIRGDLQWWNTAPEFGGKRMTRMRGKPLGRP